MKRSTSLLVAALLLGAAAAPYPAGPAEAPRAVIVDTDAGSDDLMAIAFLLARPDVRIALNLQQVE